MRVERSKQFDGIDDGRVLFRVDVVNIAQIEEAAERGLPFRIKVADGDEYLVPHPDYLFVPPRSARMRTYVAIHNDEGFASILPLLTITSLTYKISPSPRDQE